MADTRSYGEGGGYGGQW
jgi:hypothetical protein